uniref:hypothetical protein n=1 Tax=Candidatus Stercorousia sp. TaxID=3048886 RepID=UPI004025F055
MSKVISVEDFRKKATRIITIPGFTDDECFEVMIKSVSVTDMLVNGKLPNSLIKIVSDMFKSNDPKLSKDGEFNGDTMEMLEDPDKLKELMNMMKVIAKEALVEPKFEDIEDVITTEQIQKIFEQASGGVNKVIPNNEE